jgi:hypothetical protein
METTAVQKPISSQRTALSGGYEVSWDHDSNIAHTVNLLEKEVTRLSSAFAECSRAVAIGKTARRATVDVGHGGRCSSALAAHPGWQFCVQA